MRVREKWLTVSSGLLRNSSRVQIIIYSCFVYTITRDSLRSIIIAASNWINHTRTRCKTLIIGGRDRGLWSSQCTRAIALQFVKRCRKWAYMLCVKLRDSRLYGTCYIDINFDHLHLVAFSTHCIKLTYYFQLYRSNCAVQAKLLYSHSQFIVNCRWNWWHVFVISF